LAGLVEGHGVYLDGCRAGGLNTVYFSVVTVTTLGYGDYAPLGVARAIAALQSVFGLAFVGYSISQVLSVKQDSIVEYMANERLVYRYTTILQNLSDAKETIGDCRRLVRHKREFSQFDFICNKSNPFYQALKSVQDLDGYTSHVVSVGKGEDLSVYIERSLHHVEELVSFSKRYINALDNVSSDWKTKRTVTLILKLCDLVEEFSNKYTPYTKYKSEKYKNTDLYLAVLKKAVDNTRSKCLQN